MSKRTAEAADIEMEKKNVGAKAPAVDTTELNFNIGNASPLADYQKLIETRVQVDEIVGDDVTKANFASAAAAARDAIWRLLFDDAAASGDESHQKAADLLEEYKGDACFYAPWPYNEWIVKLRDELLKRNMLDFWRDVVVKKQLGPCWHRDSDLFDGDDPPPLEFYAHADCVAPFAASVKVRTATSTPPTAEADKSSTDPFASADNEAALTGKFDANISKEKPLEDYRNLMKRFVLVNFTVPHAVTQESISKITTAARDIIWSLLFSEPPAKQEDIDRAEELLEEYKGDACFYSPWPYNEWIVKVRDELLKQNMIEFWRDVIVKKQLGPCWSKDSDLFDCDDPAPLEFYEHAGCKAPFEAPVRDDDDDE